MELATRKERGVFLIIDGDPPSKTENTPRKFPVFRP
jgi:hypothetical protein